MDFQVPNRGLGHNILGTGTALCRSFEMAKVRYD